MLETVTAQKRPRVQCAWRGPSLLKIDDEGWAGTDLFQGYYFRETRFLRDLRLEVQGEPPFMSATARVAPNEIALTYVHPEVPLKGVGSGTGGKQETGGILQRDLDLYLRYLVRPASIEAVLEITNRWQETVDVELAWVLSADYADLDATKGPEAEHKQDAPVHAQPIKDGVQFRYGHEQLPFETHVTVDGGGEWSYQDGCPGAQITLERQKTVTIRRVARAVDPGDPIDQEGTNLPEPGPR